MPNASSPKHILKLTREEKQQFLDSFDYIFSDCDGVLWTLSHPIQDSGIAIKLLKDAGKKITFVSNNSVRSEKDYMAAFERAGIETNYNELVHPCKSILQYLKRMNFKGLIYCIGTGPLKKALKEAGYDTIDGPNAFVAEDFKAILKEVFTPNPVKAVVIDVDFNLTSVKLMKADQFLKKGDCILISGATDMTLPIGKLGEVIGPGPYLKVLEESTKIKAKVLGKPGKELGELLLENHSIENPKRVLFIGDMLEQDIKFGHMCGFQTLLVLTGGTTHKDLLNTTDPCLQPSYFTDSLSDFIEFFANLE